jgi:hypothetical protein
VDRYLKFKRVAGDVYYMPLRSLKGAHPVSDIQINLYFEKVSENDIAGTNSLYTEITVTSAKAYNVITDIYQGIATSEQIVIDVDGLSADIAGISALQSVGSKAFNPGWHGSSTRIKILPSDFIADDSTKVLMINDGTSDRWLESVTTSSMYASVPIPTGFSATHVNIYGSGTSAIVVYEADINSLTVTSKGTGNIGTEIDITDVASDTTNYLLIQLAQANMEQVYGGYVTIA